MARQRYPRSHSGGWLGFATGQGWLTVGLALLACVCAGRESLAGSLPQPEGEVLLVVDGAIANTNATGEARLDRQMLAALGVTKLVTTTPWHAKKTTFEGVRADRVMEAVGASGSKVLATAANDYRVTIPLSDFSEHGVILAMWIDGEELSLRTKGPIWMIYPDDARMPESERTERMIWQLVGLRVE